MNIFRKIVVVGCFFFGAYQLQAQVPDDTIKMYQKDSAIIPETNQTVLFFQENERIPAANLSKITIVTRAKKTMKLSAFLSGETMKYSDPVLADLDDDGRKELLVSNNTGGAHCCDEIYIYKNIAPNKYQHVAKMFAGNTVITTEKQFRYDLYENFGYFFTCFACGYLDTADEAPIHNTDIFLRYNKGKLSLIPGSAELKSIINDNLGKLGEKPYQKLDPELLQDDGSRKEFAINLAVYYFSFGKNMIETQKLFNKYYKFPDAKPVWAAFAKQLQYIRTQNDF
jgi:hypothetical protein